jgi:hypothetical protein
MVVYYRKRYYGLRIDMRNLLIIIAIKARIRKRGAVILNRFEYASLFEIDNRLY